VFTTTGAGHVAIGASVSLTVTVKMQLAMLWLESVAVHVTVVVPGAKVLPEGGVQTTVGLGSQLSVAVAP
jgi:hypothetical protein